MDHVLGQTEFPEYSVHPKNLFPCCSDCNRKKSDKFVDDKGSQLFLNLFIDDLPKSHYLKVRIGDKINEQCKDLETYLGYNHRQVVIYRELAASQDFIQHCMT
ncbi:MULTISPECIES: hypothetical protein [unclassified Pseudoalteromonas]|uniref:hypothetical protein n=1 Tax=unclassified Pseudoalteromonas TaxID=194690 RepID=UPI001C71C24F|nr:MULTISPECIES: hypothetical protein [unclassified Pseudoalteromonas]|tara:strand:- start:8181 stop:8489 length:309 start_codon:yes stop_codon:yes gene_type:complete